MTDITDQVARDYPDMPTELFGVACRLYEAIDKAKEGDSSGSADAYEAILTAALAVAKSSTATAHTFGAVNPYRADHIDPLRDALPRDAVAVSTALVDAYYAQTKADIKVTRSKKGAQRTVIRYPRSFSMGRHDATIDAHVPDVAPFPYPMDETLRNLPHGAYGARGRDLTSIATSAYGLELIGGEYKSWSEVLPIKVSRLLDAEPYSFAKHTTGAYVETGERKLPAWRTRHGTSYRERDSDPSNSWGDVTAGASGVKRTLVKGFTVRDDDGKVLECRKPRTAVRTTTPEVLFVGFKTYRRVAPKASTRYESREYDESFVIDEPDVLAAVVAIAKVVEPGRKVTFATRDGRHEGTVTRGNAGRYAATVQGSTVTAKGCRTAQALAKQLAPAFS